MEHDARDVQISYDDEGAGGPTLLCLTGWCGDRTVFGPLAERLADQRRTITLDWRGHGRSSRDVGDFGSAELLDDALRVIERAGVDEVVPLALSHAGWVALELRRRLGPERVPGIVLLDWMVLGPPPGFADALRGLQEPDGWEQVRGALFDMWTTGVESSAVLDYVASMAEYGFADWARAGREIAASFAAESTPLTVLDAIAAGGQPCPTLHAYALPRDPELLVAQQAYAAHHPWFQVRRVDARSHFPMLEVPQQMAVLIDEFVASLPARMATVTAP
jgi:pimeloyl-ACP methyl ester carboxylesterase